MGSEYAVIAALPEIRIEGLKERIEHELNRLSSIFSLYDEHSELSRLNISTDTTISHTVSPEFARLFIRADSLRRFTEGAFNPAVGPLTDGWGISGPVARIPDSTDLQARLNASRISFFELSAGPPWTISKSSPHARLDLNAIVKGYAADAVGGILREHGSDNFLFDLGGELVLAGRPAGRDAWSIAIEQPEGPGTRASRVISVTDIAIATSGNYRSVRRLEGQKIVHTIDPDTGRPLSNKVLSATVLADDCAFADALATALLVMGARRAMDFLQDNSEIRAYLILGGEDQAFETWSSPSFKSFVGDAN